MLVSVSLKAVALKRLVTFDSSCPVRLYLRYLVLIKHSSVIVVKADHYLNVANTLIAMVIAFGFVFYSQSDKVPGLP